MVMWPSQSQIGILLLLMLCATTSRTGIWGMKMQCNEMDRQKLLGFKQEVMDSIGMLSTWSIRQDCCGWAGVECDHFTHRVTKLSLPCPVIKDDTDCLAGEITLSNLFELEFLKYLDLSYNYLLFTTPYYSGNYSSKLLHFDLSFNHPELEFEDLSWLIHLSSLEFLNLGGIDLHNSLWLQFLGMLPSLSELHMSDCQLHHINPSIGFVNFTLLRVLDLSTNNFQSENFGKWLFNLTHDIWDLNLSQNLFQGHIPKTILDFQNLKSLRLSENRLDGPIPNWLGQIENLQHLDLSDNFFVGLIPETLGNLSFLIELSLGYNNLNGSLPKSLKQLSNLEILDVLGTSLTGIISEKNVSQLSNLQKLLLGSPALTFDFDSHWVPSFQLQRLFLAYVYSEIPSWLYTQKSLKCLGIINSSLSFDDKHEFWNYASEVEFLLLWNYSISGDMSKVLLNSKVTWLIGNSLRGRLPQISPNVIVFVAINNSFSGSLSSLLCQNTKGKNNLSYLEISDAHLSGNLTECWMNWKSLVHISLPNNGLTGKIPTSMSLLSNLKSLHLNNNKLFGYIPASLRNCQKLSILNLGENKFSGNVPYWVSQGVKVLLLRSNQFSGNIPPQLCQLSSLVVLDIADNRLSGSMPNCLHNITSMVSRNKLNTYPGFQTKAFGSKLKIDYSFVLHSKGIRLAYSSHQKLIMHMIDLSHNNLIGTIPPEIFTLATLQSLNLSHNQLTKSLPKEISNLKQLESLDLSNNLFNGEIPQSMSELSFLGFLNLSFNNFTGQIPPMAQFQRFETLCYIGNPELCGAPLTKNCTEEEKPNIIEPVEENEDEKKFLSRFYVGMGVGFATGFWGVCSSLFFNKTWRNVYFRFLDDFKDQLFVFLVLKMNIFR